MGEEEQSEASLRVKILSAEGLKDVRFLGKMKSFAVAWVDPRLKRSTKTLTSTSTNPNWNYELSFPITLQTLRNPNSCITIQILSPSSPIHHERVIGSTILPLTDVRYIEEMFTLQLWRPSGRAQGLLRVSSRIEYHSNQHSSSYSQLECVTGIPVDSSNSIQLQTQSVLDQTVPEVVSGSNNYVVVPTAPPLLPMMTTPEPELPVMSLMTQTPQTPQTPIPKPRMAEESNVLRSILIGFLGGTVAVVTVLIGGASGTTTNG